MLQESFQDSCVLHCYHKHCSFNAHIVCLASKLCEDDQIIPISGPCPTCKRDLLWGELIRREAKRNVLPILPHSKTKSTMKKHKTVNRDKGSVSHWTEGLHVSTTQ